MAARHEPGRSSATPAALAWALAAGLAAAWTPQAARAGLQEGPSRGLIGAPAEKAPPKTAPKAPAGPKLTCTLLTVEAPRGGRLEVEGTGLGKAPLVRIAGRVTRIIERIGETKIAVQIPADSDGGAVTVHSGKLQAECGTLTIVGKNG